MTQFGRRLRSLWHLEPEATFLNHGSFGACPKEVLAAQLTLREEMERHPEAFFRSKVFPKSPHNAMRPAAERLAQFVGTSCDRLAFVANATEAVSVVLHALQPRADDEILLLDCAYKAVRLAVEDVCRRTGARMVTVNIPIPLTAGSVLDRIVDAATPRTRLAIIDHIAAPTAIILPIAEVARALKAKGVRVMIDGAHALGQIALDVPGIGADWYTANAHKWLYAPKGSAFLFAAPDVARETLPLAISLWHDIGFPAAFDYLGARDVTPFLSVPAAIDFIDKFGAGDALQYMHELSRASVEMLGAVDATAIAPDHMFAAMRTYMLPQKRAAESSDPLHVTALLWERYRIQVAALVYQGHLLLRLSAPIYVERADFDLLVHALEREGWPGRY